MDIKFRCNCPITSALDVLGDKWILVIIKMMLLENKSKFKDFVESEESIATNILSTKLKFLEEVGLISKNKIETDKKTNIYKLTEKGLALTPIIIELASWSENYLRDIQPNILEGEGLKAIRNDKFAFSKFVGENYKKNFLNN